MAWISTAALVGGGALVGSMGHDHWGWNKDAIWQGAAVGAGVGMAAGAAGNVSGPASTAPTPGIFGGASEASMMSTGGYSASAPVTNGMGGFGNAMMLGQAGLGLASAFSSSGQAPQTKVALSKQGEQLKSQLVPAIKEQFGKASKGDVRDEAFGAVSQAKKQEGVRQRGSQSILQKAQGQIYNQSPQARGGAAMGGGMVKGMMKDTGERMEGLFAPTSILNNFTKEGLMNSVSQVQNMMNREANLGQFTYQSQLAGWNANQMASANKGAAIGQTAMMMGGTKLQSARIEQYKKAMA